MNRFRFCVASMVVIVAMCMPALGAAPAVKDATKAEDTLAQKHLATGVNCKDCHTSGVPVKKAAGTDEFPRIATKETCLRCHGSYKEIAAATTGYQRPYNPHISHYGELDCYQCHRAHGTSRMITVFDSAALSTNTGARNEPRQLMSATGIEIAPKGQLWKRSTANTQIESLIPRSR